MRHVFLFFFLITLIGGCIPTYKNSVSVKSNSTQAPLANITHFKQVLVIGNGNSATRVVLTNFHSSLNKIITSRGGTTNFEFESINEDPQNNKGIDLEINKNGAYLFLLPKDSSYIDFQKTKSVYAFPISPIGVLVGTTHGKAYENNFLAELFDADKKLVYSGEINFHFDPLKIELYDEAAQQLLMEISKVNVILW